MSLSLIVAFDEDYGIGNAGGLLYHLPEDLARFKQLTANATLVMGRKTWDSLPGRLPNRRHVVWSSQPVAGADATITNPSQVLELSRKENVWLIGGAGVYQELLPFVERVELTLIHAKRAADTRVPFMETFMRFATPKQQVSGTGTDKVSGEELTYTFFSYQVI